MIAAQDVLPTLVHAVDRLDWDTVRSCFADAIDVDYSELSGTRQGEITAEELLAQWQALLPGFSATQHLLGPVVVTDRAGSRRVDAHVRAWHYLPDSPPWTVAGHYEAHLNVDDRITFLTLRVFHVGGPADAPQRATARAASRPRDQNE